MMENNFENINNKIYAEQLSPDTICIDSYGKVQFDHDNYFYDKQSQMFFVKCLKKYKGKTFNYQRIRPHIDTRGYCYVKLNSIDNKTTYVYLKKLFAKNMAEDHYAVLL